MDVATPFDDANDVLMSAERWMNEGRELAIITIVAGAGDGAALIGQRIIIDADGATFGSFDSCPIDQLAARQAKLVIATGEPCLLDIALTDGHARLYVERLG